MKQQRKPEFHSQANRTTRGKRRCGGIFCVCRLYALSVAIGSWLLDSTLEQVVGRSGLYVGTSLESGVMARIGRRRTRRGDVTDITEGREKASISNTSSEEGQDERASGRASRPTQPEARGIYQFILFSLRIGADIAPGVIICCPPSALRCNICCPCPLLLATA